MFALIVAIIAIALTVATIAVTLYHGGTSIDEGKAAADAAAVVAQAQQITGAAVIRNANQGAWPADIEALVTGGELLAAPKPPAAVDGEWLSPVTGVPAYPLSVPVDETTCREINFAARGDNGILAAPYTNLVTQCFGNSADNLVAVTQVVPAITQLGYANLQPGMAPKTSTGAEWFREPTRLVATTEPEQSSGLSLQFAEEYATVTSYANGTYSIAGNPADGFYQTARMTNFILVNEGTEPATVQLTQQPYLMTSQQIPGMCEPGSTLAPGDSCILMVLSYVSPEFSVNVGWPQQPTCVGSATIHPGPGLPTVVTGACQAD